MGLRSLYEPVLANTPVHYTSDIDSIAIKKMCCKRKKRKILDIENILIPKGKIVAITGENGVGKSTFVNAFSGIIKADIVVDDEKPLSKKDRIKRSFIVMQDVNSQLSYETVYDELVENETEENNQKAQEILSKLDLAAKKDEHPFSLSGGQKQRVAIATALFLKKKYLFFDELTSGLDYDSMSRVSSLLKSLINKVEIVAVITHDKEFIMNCCDYEMNFKDGKLVEICKII